MQYNKINARYVLLLIGMGLCFVAASTDLSWAQNPEPTPPFGSRGATDIVSVLGRVLPMP